MFPFYTPWKHQKIRDSGVFKGYERETLAGFGISIYSKNFETVKIVFYFWKCRSSRLEVFYVERRS